MAQVQTAVVYRNSPRFANQNSPSETNHSYHNNQRPPMPLVSPSNQRNSIVNVPLQVVNSPAHASQDRVSEKHNLDQNDDKDHKFFIEIRSCLMTVATLAAGCAYQAGLSPPGGFWGSDGSDGQKAGNPILFDNSTTRYEAFYYCNGVSFVSSLVIIILLMNDHFSGKLLRVRVLKLMMALDLCSFMVAYAVGSCRSVKTSIIMFVLLGGVSAYVLIFTIVVGLYYPAVPVLRKLSTGARSGINRLRSGSRAKSSNNRVSDDRSEV